MRKLFDVKKRSLQKVCSEFNVEQLFKFSTFLLVKQLFLISANYKLIVE